MFEIFANSGRSEGMVKAVGDVSFISLSRMFVSLFEVAAVLVMFVHLNASLAHSDSVFMLMGVH